MREPLHRQIAIAEHMERTQCSVRDAASFFQMSPDTISGVMALYDARYREYRRQCALLPPVRRKL